MLISNKIIVRVFILSLVLLSIPFIAMQFTNEVNWTLSDFIVAFLLFSVFGLLIAGVSQNVKKTKYKRIAIILIVTLFLLIWAELAVGIISMLLMST